MSEYEGKKSIKIDCPGCARDYSVEEDWQDDGEGLLAFMGEYDEDDYMCGYM